MIGISKNNRLKPLNDKAQSKLVKSCTKSIKIKNGEIIDVIFCQECDLPVFDDDAFIAPDDNGEPSILCPLCYYPKNLEMIRFSDSGSLIYAPDLTQAQVSSLALIMYYVKKEVPEDQDMADLISDVEDLVLRRSEILDSSICQGASTPSIICQYLYMLSEEEYETRDKLLSSVRMFPSEKLAARQLAYLSTNVLKKYHPTKWVGLVQAMNKDMSSADDPP